MRRTILSILVFCCLLVSIPVLESCSGCTHRQRRMRNRNHERTELRSDHRDSMNRQYNQSEEDGSPSSSENLSADRIRQIAEGNDYDAMLDCLFEQLKVLKKIKNEYFRGSMTDKEAETRIQDITTTYQPVSTALEKASAEGNLNYRQHKRQMKLAGEYLKLMTACADRLGTDLTYAMPH